jgi:hypothetical protein
MLFAAIGIPAAMIKYVAEFKDDRTKFNQIVSSGVITSLFLGRKHHRKWIWWPDHATSKPFTALS